ncbi:chloramphenicol resistance protein [Xylariaceae sp. FL1019]|nr:chloramphenicol resistance protein [Xylariaceae sp. FL1019]
MTSSTITAPEPHRAEPYNRDSDASSHDEIASNSQDGEETEEPDVERLSRVSSGPPYSVFTPNMKRWIVAMNCVSAFMSPITGNIYFPAIPTLADSLGVSVSQINITVTTYMIFQALSPTIFGDFGDAAGRRPAFIIAFSIFLAANIGLALQRSYPALLVLRMLQSGGSSGTIALVYAVVADISMSAERGKYMGIVGAGLTIGPALGPGGLLNAYLGWVWIFWFLVILTAVWFVPFVIAVPETARKVVGNGSVQPRGWNMSLIDYYRFRHQVQDPSTTPPKQKLRFPNPLNTLRVLRHKDMAMVLFYNGALFVCFSTVTATLSTQYKQIYGYNDLVIGLLYLPIGGATTLASVGGGMLADWNFRRIAKKLNVTIDRKRGMDMMNFPVEKARLQLIYPLIPIGAAATIGYGWALQRETHVAVPLVLTFLIGFCVTGPFQVLNILIVDSYPNAPATASAANNLVRCLLGAAATGSIEPIIDAIGRGWAFTLVPLLFLIPFPVLFVIAKRGPVWRKERTLESMRQAEKEKAAAELSEKDELPSETAQSSSNETKS